jgi:hypothetical protein
VRVARRDTKPRLSCRLLGGGRLGGGGEHEPRDLRTALAVSDPRALLAAIAAIFRVANERAYELFEIMRKAAAADPNIEERRTSGAEDRRRDQSPVARQLKRGGVLRTELSERQAVDILWLYSSADIYRLLVHDSQWPPERYEQWLAQTLIDALLER